MGSVTPSDTMSLEISVPEVEVAKPLGARIWSFLVESWVPSTSAIRIACAMLAIILVFILLLDPREGQTSVLVGRLAFTIYAALGALAANRFTTSSIRFYLTALSLTLPLFALYSALESGGSMLSLGILGLAILSPLLFALAILDLLLVAIGLIVGHAVVLAVHPNANLIDTTAQWILWMSALGLGLTLSLSLIIYRQQLRESERQLALARDNAIATSQAKSELMANLSDKIRTPMNGIIGLVDLVLDTEVSEEQRRYLSMVQTDADRLMLLLNDLLDLSKMHAQKLKLDIKTFNLPDLLRATMTPLALRAEEKKLPLEWETSSKLPVWVRGDPRRLRQVLVNLIDNAIKFTQKGEISIIVRRVAGRQRRTHVAFTVRDTGPGIPRDKLELVRNSSMRVDTANARSSEGAGLGLAICTQLVGLMDGHIIVESSAHGSTIDFTVYLPPDKEKEEKRQEQSSLPQVVEKLNSARVLLVEDNTTNRLFAERVMQKAGHAVVTAENGQVALEHMETKPFDIVFMDVQMPVMDGLEASRAIRERERDGNRRIPIVALTAHVLEEQISLCLDAGMDMHLGKPVYGSDLLDTIHTLLADQDESGAPVAVPVHRKRATASTSDQRERKSSSEQGETLAPKKRTFREKSQPPMRSHDTNDAATATTSVESSSRTQVRQSEIVHQGPRTEVFDSSRLLDMLDNDRGLIDDMLIEFIKQQADIVSDLHDSIRADDSVAAAKLAHKLKGSLLTLCANQSAKTAAELEQTFRAGHIETGKTMLETLVVELAALRAELGKQGFATGE